jgi:hypothetical protein
MKVAELEHKQHQGGTRAVVTFENGYGASVVSNSMMSYTTPGCPYEIAVLDREGRLTYDTPITDDVLGYLTEDEANDILARIEALPAV